VRKWRKKLEPRGPLLAAWTSTGELPPLDEEELQASLAMCDASMAELEGGGGLSISEARELSLQRLRQLTQ